MKPGTRVVDHFGNIGVITLVEDPAACIVEWEHPTPFGTKSRQNFSNLMALPTTFYPSLECVLEDLHNHTKQQYDSACQSGNDHGQYVFSAQLDMLNILSARVLGKNLRQV